VSIPFPPQKNKAFYHNNKKQSTTNKYPDFSAWRKKEQINQPPSLHKQSIIMTHSTETYYYYVPNLQALDPTAREVDPSAYAWVQPTIIEDEDLTFGGKSLSAWYEEDRRRHSSGSSSSSSSSSDEEERRGRERVRRNYSRSGKSHKK
jgi:hypothetical protein